jgi:protein SCO1/2
MKNIRVAGAGPRFNLRPLACALFACALALAPAEARQKGRRGAGVGGGASAVKPIAYYSCPMHPDVKAKKKGDRCPKCGMDLRPVYKEEADSRQEETGSPVTAATPAESAAASHDDARHASVIGAIPDVELLDQDGRTIHFYTDLVKGKVVAVQFIFTTCTTICPPLGATFARVQKDLGERAGRDVRLISISVDPATDTPERMKAWGAKFHAAEGWTLVTGAKPEVDKLLLALGAATASPADHSPTILIGNDAAGQWTRTYGLARPGVLVKLIGDAVEGRLESSPDSTAKESTQK